MREVFAVLSLFFCTAVVGMATQESVLIGPGDKLHIQVFDTPEMEQHPQVTDSGTVPLMLLGDIKVAGLTPAQAGDAIQDALLQKQVMLHPHVAVTIEENSTGEVYVMGQVKDPGSYDLTAPTPILKVLALAGGLNVEADRHITVEHHNDAAQKQTYYLSNNASQALDDSLLVYPGDTVVVPKAGVVYVLGDVAKPGGYVIDTNDSKLTVMQALSMAGYANKTALLSKAKLLRTTSSGEEDVPLKLAAIQDGKQPDIRLEAGDKLFIPFSWMKNIVLGSSAIASTSASALIYAKP